MADPMLVPHINRENIGLLRRKKETLDGMRTSSTKLRESIITAINNYNDSGLKATPTGEEVIITWLGQNYQLVFRGLIPGREKDRKSRPDKRTLSVLCVPETGDEEPKEIFSESFDEFGSVGGCTAQEWRFLR